MPARDGQFIWYELMTTDVAAAEAFYRHVVGWDASPAGIEGVAYTRFSTGPTPVAGLMTLPEGAGGRPGWIGSIAVVDVDASAAAVKRAGGAIHCPPTEIPGIGRFAGVADPHGAAFLLFAAGPSSDEDCAPPPAGSTAPGHVGWRELHAGDRETAFAFYAGLFGWTPKEAIDLGPMGVYQLFATGDGPAVGGLMTKPPQVQGPPAWLYYFTVPGIDAGAARITEAGGQVLNGPHQVPGGAWILHGLDPQGALFALTAAER
ncbi:VOC family protein [Methylobacterium sp. J-090]|uniref:VOC family protein n=1 Tax=Methylobacterium sp. J-090 TaxID=2836666 RepID=UPI001FBAF3BF|nr:VOC family protein [Methylobacterium sp. J-090]MCJ2080436.1 VOC family protein [Methylobacterium sp. J-090]